ncbi:DUF86 domain-containing protein [bacterium]|nr:DUF86 domain-containing protein [bacterium]MBU1883428.1 DUF86 domain-containing protein [bacterium]
MDKANLEELINFILTSIELIKNRFKIIKSSDDFLKDNDGLMRLDAISMRLQSIGEALKNIDKRDKDFLLKAADNIYWSKIIKTREILTHHYIDIDSETIFDICKEKLDELEDKIILLKTKIPE